MLDVRGGAMATSDMSL